MKDFIFTSLKTSVKACFCRVFRQSYENLGTLAKLFNALIILIFISSGAIAQAAPRCDEVLQNADVLAGIAELAKLKLDLEQAKAIGHQSVSRTALEHAYKTKENDLMQILQDMTRDQLKLRLKEEIYRLQSKVEETGKREKKTKDEQNQLVQEEVRSFATPDGHKAIFHEITHGSYQRNRGTTYVVEVTISKDFEMMATPTTQIIWKTVAELANKKMITVKHFGFLKKKIQKYHINPDPSFHKGDTLPLEQASFDEVQQWIEALNELSQEDTPGLYKLIVGHKKGAVYRLPTDSEWEFVLSDRGRNSDFYIFGKQESSFENSVWHKSNSAGQTQPVAKKQPLLVENSEFYDMIGNVSQMTLDFYVSEPIGGTDPIAAPAIPHPSDGHVVRGGSYDMKFNFEKSLFSTTRLIDNDEGSSPKQVGFRLLREKP